MDKYDDLVFLVAGFDNTVPKFYRLHNKVQSFKPVLVPGNYAADGRREFAKERLQGLNINNETEVADLKSYITQTIQEACRKFPLVVGGTPRVEALYPKP